ncbi:MAG: tetratricopeptide repeat protein [Candidatus Obscuribacterales bacterium]|nr:tetratricopeptide repeat protein [Candidatus Obscuribacterales bacterium]
MNIDLSAAGVPDGLSSSEYYELGLQFRLAGWVGLARAALSRVVEMDGDSSLARKAAKVLRTQLPRMPVPAEAEQRNIEGYNLMQSDPARAKAVFEDLMNQYPDFEWPFSNRAWLKLAEGDVAGAKSMAKYLLAVNPEHLRSISLMINIAFIEKDFDEGNKYLDRALALYPNDAEFEQMKLVLRLEMKGPPPDELPDDLDAAAYFELGTLYKLIGRLELARAAMNKVISLNTDADLVARAQNVLKTQLPRGYVPAEAERLNIEANKLIATDKEQALSMFEQLMMNYPEFEWPFMGMASVMAAEGKINKAERLVQMVIAHNPELLRAQQLLCGIYAAEHKYDKSIELIDKLLASGLNEDDSLSLELLKAQCRIAMSQMP